MQSYRDYVAPKAMRSISALDDRRKLRIADSRFYAGGANRSRSNANLDNVRTRENEFLNDFTGDYITSLCIF